MEGLELFFGLCLLAFCIIGASRYNKLRRKWKNIIGVFGSYIILLGIMLFVMTIISLMNIITGNENGTVIVDGIGETVLIVIIIIACLGYMVMCMRKCSTVKEKILLPFAACMIGLGFCWRLLGSIVFHIPMYNGSEEASGEFDIGKMPNIIFDDANNRWQLQHRNGDHVVYHNDAGQTVTIYSGQLSRSGATTSAGNFHWF